MKIQFIKSMVKIVSVAMPIAIAFFAATFHFKIIINIIKNSIAKNNFINSQVGSCGPIIGFIIITSSACTKFVQIDPPSTQIVTASVFNDNNAATAALTEIYTQMQAESWNMSQVAGLMADELQSPSSSAGVVIPYTNSMSAFNDPGPWTRAYNYIFEANAVIEGVKNSTTIIPAIQKQLIGEAEFIRAFWNFYLTSCYGDVPLVTSTDYKVNSLLARTPISQVYDNIIIDLKDAESILNNDYVNATDTTSYSERIRPNKASATALLARVYLFAGKYTEAEQASAVLLADDRYELVQDLNRVFLANSTEAIWQLGISTPASYNTVDGFNFVLQAAPDPYGGVNTVTISPWLWDNFEPGDNRKAAWIGSLTVTDPDTVTYYFPYKYKTTNPDNTEYTMMLRLAEQYLIHAEALAKENKNLGIAIGDLNTIRSRAGLGDYMGPEDNADSIFAAILKERRIELFSEWGHRWFDLVRTDRINSVMDVITPLKSGQPWRPEQALFPIPFGELQVDHNLAQNPGY